MILPVPAYRSGGSCTNSVTGTRTSYDLTRDDGLEMPS
jgi:hypothetical protein